MADSSFVPEQQLAFSPGLAATIGLEAAVLLQLLAGVQPYLPTRHRRGRAWTVVPWRQLRDNLPFWDDDDLRRLLQRLVDLGILRVEGAEAAGAELLFAMDQGEAASGTDRAASAGGTAAPAADSAAPARSAAPPLRQRPRAGPLPAGWRPGDDMLSWLEVNHGIARSFALEQLEDFAFYWRERGEAHYAWENKFRQHVLAAWRRRQQAAGEAFRTPALPLDGNWRPNADALEILLRAGVARDFIDDAIPEFVLYWRERGSAPKELNARFVQHVRRQWARFRSSLTHSTEPRRIATDWQPDRDVFEILAMSYIDPDFARALIPEFVLYWRDSNQLHSSWNSKFLQHVKYQWARQHQLTTEGPRHGGQQGTGGTGRTRDRSLEQDLRDTSWAD